MSRSSRRSWRRCSTRRRPAGSSSAASARRRSAADGARADRGADPPARAWSGSGRPSASAGSGCSASRRCASLGGAETIVRDHLERALARSSPASRTSRARSSTTSSRRRARRSRTAHADLAEYAAWQGELGRCWRARHASGSSARSTAPAAAASGTRSSTTCSPTPCSPGARERRLERERQVAARRHRRLLARRASPRSPRSPWSPAIAVFALVEREQRPAHARQATCARARGERAARPAGRARPTAWRSRSRAARLEPDARSEAVLRQALFESRLRRFASGRGAGLGAPVQLRRAVAARRRRQPAHPPHDLAGGGARTFPRSGDGHRGGARARELLLSGDETAGRSCGARPRARSSRAFAAAAPSAVAFSDAEAGSLVTTLGGDGARRACRRRPRAPALPQPGPVLGGVLDPAGSLVATISREPGGEQRARVFDAASGGCSRSCRSSGSGTSRSARTARCSRPRSARRLDRALASPLGPAGPGAQRQRPGVEDVAFNPDGTLLAAAGVDGVTRVWTVATGDRLYLFTGHTNPVETVAWSPDGRALADASSDRSARLYAIRARARQGRRARRAARERRRHERARVRPDRSAHRDRRRGRRRAALGRGPEQRLASARVPRRSGLDGRVLAGRPPRRLGRWATTRPASGTSAPAGSSTSCARPAGRGRELQPDGRLVVTASSDGAARLWRAATGGRSARSRARRRCA